MPRYIDADSLKQRIIDNWYTADDIVVDVDREPTAEDVVKVVRCKDCAVQKICRYKTGLGENGFCSQGERREDNDEKRS